MSGRRYLTALSLGAGQDTLVAPPWRPCIETGHKVIDRWRLHGHAELDGAPWRAVHGLVLELRFHDGVPRPVDAAENESEASTRHSGVERPEHDLAPVCWSLRKTTKIPRESLWHLWVFIDIDTPREVTICNGDIEPEIVGIDIGNHHYESRGNGGQLLLDDFAVA